MCGRCTAILAMLETDKFISRTCGSVTMRGFRSVYTSVRNVIVDPLQHWKLLQCPQEAVRRHRRACVRVQREVGEGFVSTGCRDCLDLRFLRMKK